jgi:hypothetical protein
MSIVSQSQGTGFTTGLQIGVGGTELSGFKQMPVSDLYISGFATNLRLSNVRLLMFTRMAVWSADNAGVHQAAPASGSRSAMQTSPAAIWISSTANSSHRLERYNDVPISDGCDMANAVSGAADGVAGIRFTN